MIEGCICANWKTERLAGTFVGGLTIINLKIVTRFSSDMIWIILHSSLSLCLE